MQGPRSQRVIADRRDLTEDLTETTGGLREVTGATEATEATGMGGGVTGRIGVLKGGHFAARSCQLPAEQSLISFHDIEFKFVPLLSAAWTQPFTQACLNIDAIDRHSLGCFPFPPYATNQHHILESRALSMFTYPF